MKIRATYNPSEVRVTDEESVILQSTVEEMKELARTFTHGTSIKKIQKTEHDFYEKMTAKYGGKLAGELMLRLWKMTKKE